MFNVIDEYTRECLSIRVRRKLNAQDVLTVLSKLFIQRGVPDHVQITALNLSQSELESGLLIRMLRRCISSPEVHGKMVIVNRSTASFRMNF